jgi:putative protease
METQIGQITHYYSRIGVAVLVLTGELTIGETIHILGHTTDINQQVTSMEIEHNQVQSVGPGMEVALKMTVPVRSGDFVYKVVEG